MKTIAFCMLIFYLGVWASCHKEHDCRGTIHAFEAFFKAHPDKDSIRINDTVWVELNTATQFKDLITNSIIDYSGAANLGTVISYLELTGGDVSNPGSVPVANSFETVLVNGIAIQSLAPEQLREFLFKEENGMYLFKVGLVPKKKGVFMISVANAANVYLKNDRCKKSDFKLAFKDTDQHLYLYAQKRPGYVVSSYEAEHGYAFKVY